MLQIAEHRSLEFILTKVRNSLRMGRLEFVTLHLRRTHKAVKRKVRVQVPSHGRTRGADAKGVCPSSSCTRRIKADNRAISGTHKAVRHKVRVEVLPRRGFARITAPTPSHHAGQHCDRIQRKAPAQKRDAAHARYQLVDTPTLPRASTRRTQSRLTTRQAIF